MHKGNTALEKNFKSGLANAMLKKIASREEEEERKETQSKREEFGFNMWNLAPLKPENEGDAASSHHTEMDQSDSETSSSISESPTEDGEGSDQKPSAAISELQKLVKKKKKEEKRVAK